MKYLFAVAGLLFLSIGCKKEKAPTARLVNGDVHATLNGEPWNANGLGQRVFNRGLCDYDCLYIGGSIGDFQTFLTGLSFLNVRKEVGIRQGITISPYGNYGDQVPPFTDDGAAMKALLFADLITTNDGDQTCDVYKLLLSDSANNYIQITEQSDSFREISGAFSATFVRTFSCGATIYTEDTFRFRNGTFHFTDMPDLR